MSKITSKLKALNDAAIQNKPINNIVALFTTIVIYIEYFFYLKDITEIEDLDNKYDSTELSDEQYDELELDYDIVSASRVVKMINDNREKIKESQKKSCLKKFIGKMVSIIAIEFAIIYFIIPSVKKK